MKFYSYSNKNRNYSKAISLKNVRSIHLCDGSGRSEVRFSVRVEYVDGNNESLPHLFADEAKKVFDEIVKILNKA